MRHYTPAARRLANAGERPHLPRSPRRPQRFALFHTKAQRHKGIKTRRRPSVPLCLCVRIMFHTKAQRHKGIKTRKKPSVPLCRCVRIMFHTKAQRHKGIKTRKKPSVPSCLCVRIMFHTKAQRHKGIKIRKKPSVPLCLCVSLRRLWKAALRPYLRSRAFVLSVDGSPAAMESRPTPPFACIRAIRGWPLWKAAYSVIASPRLTPSMNSPAMRANTGEDSRMTL